MGASSPSDMRASSTTHALGSPSPGWLTTRPGAPLRSPLAVNMWLARKLSVPTPALELSQTQPQHQPPLLPPPQQQQLPHLPQQLLQPQPPPQLQPQPQPQ